MIVTIYLTIVLLSLLVLHIAVRHNKAARLISKIPGPFLLPFLGNLLMFNVSSEKMWSLIIHLLDEYYPIVRVCGFRMKWAFICHPDDMKVLLSCKKNIEKSETVYGRFRAIDNDGLIVSGGEKWRRRRKMINPAFNPNLLEVYTEIVNEHTEQLIKNIKNQNTEIVQDIVPIFLKLALGIICEAAMGVNPNKFGTKKEEQFRHSFDDISEIAFYRLSRPYIKDWMMKFISAGRKQQRALKYGREFTNKIIQERRKYHEKVGYRKFQSIVDDVEDESSKIQRKRLAVLDLLLAAEMDNLIDEQGVKEEVETFIVAGYETSGIAMAFALMLLSENKAVQDLARAEVTDILNQTNGVLTIADINKLDYLDRCIKETLRLYPSAPLIARSIMEDIKLSNYKIPHGTEVAMQFFSLHRDPNFWSDPEKFDPDRFLPEEIQQRHPFAYLPFSAGPRACIGSKFAMLEVKAVVARILYNFYIEPVDSTANVSFKMHVTLKPKDPCPIKLIRINRLPDVTV